MADIKPPWATTGKRITADLWNALVRLVLANRVTVSGPGLSAVKTPGGQDISLSLTPWVAWATITTQVPAASGATQGKGAGTLEFMAYSTSDVATATSTGQADVPIYSGGKDAIAVGRRVLVIRDRTHWHVAVDYCP